MKAGLLPPGTRCRFEAEQPSRKFGIVWEQAVVTGFNPTADAGNYDLDKQDQVKGYRIGPLGGVRASSAWPTSTMVLYYDRFEQKGDEKLKYGVISGFNEKANTYNVKVIDSND